MQRWIVFLRAVNVAGQGKLPMAAFRAALADAGFLDVQTYIQTGNALVSSALSRDQVEAAVEAVLRDVFDLERPANAVTRDELEAALANNPYPQASETPQRLHLVFLRGAITFDPDAFQKLCDKGEEFALIDQVFYLYTPNGTSKSRPAARYEKFVRAEMVTARNLNSCLKIAALARGV
ncbi:DUF1697 domain-containing protein [Celeribacter marinus]|uniref:Uncharacterized protein n=1 Tax=Celeribacter marinus TaxID=1397108 RepID=A0A0N7HIZ7_9RHOB|nr:DUF1697 domain-containing protein [Celeribacter marinus]ALI56613.1 hypothetical protein IMCC12053_2666 [Celeribacter marinus]SFK60533.1 Uncharacterized conserved protein, DUF1697 family [Celeribacter marinus]